MVCVSGDPSRASVRESDLELGTGARLFPGPGRSLPGAQPPGMGGKVGGVGSIGPGAVPRWVCEGDHGHTGGEVGNGVGATSGL